MTPTMQDKRQPLPTILTVYRPIEEYWGTFGSAFELGPDPTERSTPSTRSSSIACSRSFPGFPFWSTRPLRKPAGPAA